MGKRRKRPVQPLGYVNFTKLIFRPIKRLKLIGNWFPYRSATSIQPVKRGGEKTMVSRVEVRFIDKSDFVKKGNGFILRDCPDWELDSTILLDLTDLLDDIADF